MDTIKQDTIAAISTGLTSAGIGIVRISGPDAIAIAGRIFRMKRGMIQEVPSHTIHYGHIYDGPGMLDEVMVSIMRAPSTYTREDIVEINCHGGQVVVREILALVLRCGARLAEPGEFTKRAFLNGRIDLSQAEAVMDLIGSGSRAAMDASLRQLKGSLRDTIEKNKDAILQTVAGIEAALDDPEHFDTGEDFRETVTNDIGSVYEDLKSLSDTFENGRIIREGIRAVITGKPNAGKSSIMNLLLGENRAIVTEIAGTTRDTLEEAMNMDGLRLNIIDTAGIRNATDPVEQIGVSRAFSALQESDLVIYVIDGSTELDENDHQIIEQLQGKRVVVLLNKCDLPLRTDPEEVHRLLSCPVLSVSARQHTGMEALFAEIRDMFETGKLAAGEESCLTNIRHYEEIRAALASLDLTMESIRSGMPEDFFTIDLMDAYRHLANVVGEDVGDDLVDRIFAGFCMGK